MATNSRLTAEEIQERTAALDRELKRTGPSWPLEVEAKDLLQEIERSMDFEVSVALALQERIGRDPVDGDIITPEDDARAEEISAGWEKYTIGDSE